MTEKIFDDYMRDKLRNYASPVPDGMWERIQNEKRRRPVGFFWSNRLLVMGLLLLIVSAIGGLMWWESKDNVQNIAATTGMTTGNQANNKHVSTTEVNDKNNTEISNSTVVPSKDATVASYKNVEVKTAAIKESNLEKIASTKNKQTVIAKDKGKTQLLSKKIDDRTLLMEKGKKVGNKNFAFNPTQGTEYLPQGQSITSNNQEQIVANEMFSIAPKNYGKGQLMFVGYKSIFPPTNKLSSSLQNMKLSNIVDCPSTTGNGRNDWYYEAYFSPDYTMKSVKGNAANNAYLQKKDSTESMRIGYSIGGRISKNIGENLIFKAGLQFSQINERFTLRTENERITTIIITSKTVTDAFGNTTIQNDTTSVTKIGYLVKTSNNKYRSIEVPVTLGYEFGNDKLKFSVNAGAIINVASWYKGKTLDTSYQSIALSSKSNGDLYKTSVGLSLYGSVSIIKPITERWDVFAEPYFRYSLSSISANMLGYNQRFSTIGLSMGLRYKLNAKKQR